MGDSLERGHHTRSGKYENSPGQRNIIQQVACVIWERSPCNDRVEKAERRGEERKRRGLLPERRAKDEIHAPMLQDRILFSMMVGARRKRSRVERSRKGKLSSSSL